MIVPVISLGTLGLGSRENIDCIGNFAANLATPPGFEPGTLSLEG
jgi:hypothetical protein